MSIDNLLYIDKYWEKTAETMYKKMHLSQEDLVYVDLYAISCRHFILNEVLEDEFQWGTPKKIEIAKEGSKKKRIVYLFDIKQRVMLGVLYRILSDYFSEEISDNCYSYKSGVSTVQAVREIQDKNSDSSLFGLKLDISSYFNSVSEDRVTNMIETLFQNEKNTHIYKLIKDLYSIRQVLYKGQVQNEYMSLMAGTAVAAFFANYCLKDIDNYFKNNGVLYARYSDDIIFFSKTEDKKKEYLDYINSKLSEYNLSINAKKYCHFEPSEDINFLGLKYSDHKIDIEKDKFIKIKKRIKKSCKKGRQRILKGESYEKVARSIIHSFNHRTYKCFIEDFSKFGWGYYAFRFITTDETLRQIDFYMRDQLRWLYTGKNNSANIKKVSDEKLKSLGYVSMVMMYKLFKTDFDAYCNEVSLLH